MPLAKYTPELGAKILQLMSEGYSIVAAAGMCDVGRQTIYDWRNSNESFRNLLEIAHAKRAAHWETELKETQSGARVTVGLKALGGMKLDEWSDNKQITIDQTVNHNHTLQIADLTTEQLASLAAMLAPKADDSLLIEHEE